MRAVPSCLPDLRGCVSPSPQTPRLPCARGPGTWVPRRAAPPRGPTPWTPGRPGPLQSARGLGVSPQGRGRRGVQGQVGKTRFRGWADGGDRGLAP